MLRRTLRRAAVLWPAAGECRDDDGCVGRMSATPIGSSLRTTLWEDSGDSGLAEGGQIECREEGGGGQSERMRRREGREQNECLYEVWDSRDFKLAESGEREREKDF